MKMQILIDGQGFQGFTDARVSRSLFHASGQFQFTTSPQNNIIQGVTPQNYPLQVQRQCTILVENIPFLNGFCEDVTVRRSVSQVDVMISGRDRTMDIIDSTLDVDTVSEFTGNITLKQMAEKIIAKLGIKNVKVIEEVSTRKFKKGELINYQQGETAFAFLSKYADKINVLLTTDGKGNLVITNGTTDNPVASITPNIIIQSHLVLKTGKEFNKYVCYAQATASADLTNIDDNDIAGNTNVGTAINTQIRKSRQLVFLSDTPLLAGDAKNRAIWESNFRQAMGFRYQVQVQGFTYNKVNIWEPNLSVNVDDPFASIKSTLIVETVRFHESLQGSTTTLILVPPNAFQLQLQQDYRQGLANDVAQPFADVDPDSNNPPS